MEGYGRGMVEMKNLMMVVVIVLLTGCQPSAGTSQGHDGMMYQIPELAGCKTFKVSDGYKDLWIVRCPSMETTSVHESHSCGKNCTSTTDTVVVTPPQ